MKSYGVRVYKQGLDFHFDNRWRDIDGVAFRIHDKASPHRKVGVIKGWSRASAKRLEFVSANAELPFQSIVTLTYRANVASWETDADRNRRVARGSKRDLNRFLTCLRRELGAYLWVMEFQARGVIHFHL